MPCSSPIVFLIFRRPDLTSRVFQIIRQVQPKTLLVVADGPRSSSETELCRQARAVTERIDWDCKVLRNYSDVNMGCRMRVSSGLDWAFEHVEEAIILEDDCLPCPSFFEFCQELLKEYKHDERVMHIGGNNFCCSIEKLNYSYYFSMYPHVWGWASWRRAWELYDVNMKSWPEFINQHNLSNWFSSAEVERRKDIWQSVYKGEIDTWDYQWLFTILSQNGLAILPKNNLISNIGFREDATHTIRLDRHRGNLATENVVFPLIHPPFVVRDHTADEMYEAMNLYGTRKNSIKKIVHSGIEKISTLFRF